MPITARCLASLVAFRFRWLVVQPLLLQQRQQVAFRLDRPQLFPPPQLPIMPLHTRPRPMRPWPRRQIMQLLHQHLLALV